MAQDFWIKTAKGQLGPFTASQLRKLSDKGELRPTHKISSDQQRWYAASTVGGLTFPETEIVEAEIVSDPLDGLLDSANMDGLAEFLDQNLPDADAQNNAAGPPVRTDEVNEPDWTAQAFGEGHRSTDSISARDDQQSGGPRTNKRQVLEQPDSNAAFIDGKINSWSTKFGNPDERLCPGCKVPLLIGQVLCMSCGYHTILAKRVSVTEAGTWQNNSNDEQASQTPIPLGFDFKGFTRLLSLFALLFGLGLTLLGLVILGGAIAGTTGSRSESLVGSAVMLLPGILCLLLGVRGLGGPNVMAAVFAKTALRKFREHTSRCPECGTKTCVRTIPNSIQLVDPMTKQWSWRTLTVCVGCMEVPCMIEGCEQRATVTLPHSYSYLPIFKDMKCPLVPNDLWLCKGHGDGMPRYSFTMRNTLRVALWGAVLLGVAYATKSIPLGIISTVFTVLAVALYIQADHSLKSRGLKKKQQYLMVRSGFPDDVRFD